jgi:hypothetical protein
MYASAKEEIYQIKVMCFSIKCLLSLEYLFVNVQGASMNRVILETL